MPSRRFISARMSITRRAEPGSSEAIGSLAPPRAAPSHQGALHEGACDGGALLLTAGKVGAALERVLGHADARERVHRAPLLVHGEIAQRPAHERHAAEEAETDIGEDR